MRKGRLARVVGHFTAMLRQESAGDGELLELFIRQRDETAFEMLVRHHGPMVFGVCLRLLGNVHDAEDAFQATFLVLARKAASVRPRHRVGNWLYGVAYRTALEARRAEARRRAREAKVVPRNDSTSEDSDDLREVLDHELARLPDHYREVIVLGDLEGKGRKEVAGLLGCPEGTVASRLARARALLQRRLEQRRVAVSAGALMAALAPSSTFVPPFLVASTVKGASLSAAGQSAAGVISAQVCCLTERMVKTMLVLKLKAMTAVLVLLGFLGTGVGWVCLQGAADQPAKALAAAPGPSQEEQMRREIALLKQQLQQALERTMALEARLAPLPEEQPEVCFQGKPASYWIKRLKDRDADYFVLAVKALGAIAEVDRTVIPPLLEALRDRDRGVRLSVANSLSELGPEGFPLLTRALKETRKENRAWVCYVLEMMGPNAREAVPALIQLLKSRDRGDRIAAAVVLGSIGPEAREAVPVLMEWLKDPKKLDCYIAADSLGLIGPDAKAAVPALMDLLKNKELVRFTIDSSFEPILPGRAIELSPGVFAAEALGKIGPNARAALPALRETLKAPLPGPGMFVWSFHPNRESPTWPFAFCPDIVSPETGQNWARGRLDRAIRMIDPKGTTEP